VNQDRWNIETTVPNCHRIGLCRFANHSHVSREEPKHRLEFNSDTARSDTGSEWYCHEETGDSTTTLLEEWFSRQRAGELLLPLEQDELGKWIALGMNYFPLANAS
jgi:hypothetical protein